MRERHWPAAFGVVVLLALSLGGCAHSQGRLPECKGRSVPINTLALEQAEVVRDGR